MSDLNSTLLAALLTHYERMGAKARELAAPLDEAQFWRRPFPFGNSFGHLVLHLTGNLKYYIGAEIAGSAYVRDREREFTEKDRPAKADVLKRFDEAIEIVLNTVRAQNAESWGLAYTAMREEDARNRLGIFLRCLGHLHHHVGQMNYLCAELARLD
jgi:DinB superfamily